MRRRTPIVVPPPRVAIKLAVVVALLARLVVERGRVLGRAALVALGVGLVHGAGEDARHVDAGDLGAADALAVAEFDALVKMAANHPNELHRIYANKAAASGNWRDAAKSFRIA